MGIGWLNLSLQFSTFLMAHLKWSWQYLYSCIVEILWKTLVWELDWFIRGCINFCIGQCFVNLLICPWPHFHTTCILHQLQAVLKPKATTSTFKLRLKRFRYQWLFSCIFPQQPKKSFSYFARCLQGHSTQQDQFNVKQIICSCSFNLKSNKFCAFAILLSSELFAVYSLM